MPRILKGDVRAFLRMLHANTQPVDREAKGDRDTYTYKRGDKVVKFTQEVKDGKCTSFENLEPDCRGLSLKDSAKKVAEHLGLVREGVK